MTDLLTAALARLTDEQRAAVDADARQRRDRLGQSFGMLGADG